MASNVNDVAPNAAVAVAKKRRIRRDGEFEKSRRLRNKLDAANIKALNTRLNKWFKKTNTPTVALTLLRSKGKNGQMYIKYSGPKEFESFARSKTVARKFSSIVTEKMKEVNLRAGGDDDESSVRGCGGIDNAVVQVLLEQNVLDLPIDEKRKLITEIVVGSDMKRKGKWSSFSEPEWWPEDVLYQSPNKRNPSMGRDDMDLILESCILFIKSILDDDADDNDPNDDNTNIEERDDLMEGDDGRMVEEGDADIGVVSGEEESLGEREEVEIVREDVIDEAVPIDLVEEIVIDEDDRGERSGVQGIVDEVPCQCSKVVACAANETCCYVWGETVMMEVDPPTCVACAICSRHFHQFCVSEKEGAKFKNGWKCGCDVQVNDLKTLDGFKRKDRLDYLFRRWDSGLKTFISAILKEKIGSRRNRIVKIGLSRLFPRYLHNYQWLVGELDGNLKQSIARIGSSLPCFRKYSFNKREEIKRLTLAPEVLAFLLHKEENIPFTCARRLLIENHSS